MKTLVYQVYLISTAGLKEVSNHLDRLVRLGVDCLCLSPPLSPSPRFDHGYDVADYRAVDPRFGTMADLDELVTKAHNRGIKILLDLVLNHTSTEHPWFKDRPDYYYWEDNNRKGWHNLFNGGPAWQFNEEKGQYYLHLFHQEQADLRWFDRSRMINQDLVQEFREIVKFWTKEHNIDGFRLDVPQGINKDFSKEVLGFSDLLFGEQAAKVLNAVFPPEKSHDIFLMMECFDPTYGELVEYYYKNTAVNFVLNVLVKDAILDSEENFKKVLKKSTAVEGFMLDLESHDSARFPSKGIEAEDAIWYLFNNDAEGVCMYQGQELGLNNPTKEELPDELMLKLDAQTKMRFEAGDSLDDLRPLSRANARIPIPDDEYLRQQKNPDSFLNLTTNWIERWKS